MASPDKQKTPHKQKRAKKSAKKSDSKSKKKADKKHERAKELAMKTLTTQVKSKSKTTKSSKKKKGPQLIDYFVKAEDAKPESLKEIDKVLKKNTRFVDHLGRPSYNFTVIYRYNSIQDKIHIWLGWLVVYARGSNSPAVLNQVLLETNSNLDSLYYVTMETMSGQQFGRLKLNSRKIDSGKNRGRANWTNVFKQAAKELRSKADHKIKKGGYSYSYEEILKQRDEERAFNAKNLTDGKKETMSLHKPNVQIYPMRAQLYRRAGEVIDSKTKKPKLDDNGKMISEPKIRWPSVDEDPKVWQQPKLDGYRAMAFEHSKTKKLIMYTRGQEPVLNYEDLKVELGKLLRYIRSHGPKKKKSSKKSNWRYAIIDGEVFLPNQEYNLDTFVGIGRTKTLTERHKNIMNLTEYWIFDIYVPDDPNGTFENRYAELKKLFNAAKKKYKFKKLKLVPTKVVKNEKSLMKTHKKHRKAGYEGTIVRNGRQIYKVVRSSCPTSPDMFKIKDWLDFEFQIVGFKEGKGSRAGTVVWKVLLPPYKTWRPKVRKALLSDRKKLQRDDMILRNRDHDSDTFDVNPDGTHSERQLMFKTAYKYMNKYITVRFRDWSSKGVPTHATTSTVLDRSKKNTAQSLTDKANKIMKDALAQIELESISEDSISLSSMSSSKKRTIP